MDRVKVPSQNHTMKTIQISLASASILAAFARSHARLALRLDADIGSLIASHPALNAPALRASLTRGDLKVSGVQKAIGTVVPEEVVKEFVRLVMERGALSASLGLTGNPSLGMSNYVTAMESLNTEAKAVIEAVKLASTDSANSAAGETAGGAAPARRAA